MGADDWEKRGRKGRFAKSAFAYDEARDAYGCPGGQWLTSTDRGRDGQGREYRRYRTAACAACPLRGRCTGSAQGRSVKRYAGEEYKEAMALVLQQPRARAVYGRRMVIAERVHAELRERLGLRRFYRRGLGAVRAEFALYCIAFNLRRAPARPGSARRVCLGLVAGGRCDAHGRHMRHRCCGVDPCQVEPCAMYSLLLVPLFIDTLSGRGSG